MPIRDLIKRLAGSGWYLVRMRENYHQFRHDQRPGLITLPGRPADAIGDEAARHILKQAGLDA